jgi:hypothetical protein
MRDPEVLQKVKLTLQALTVKAPGRAIEVRVPPYAAVQCGQGPTHTRCSDLAGLSLRRVDLGSGCDQWCGFSVGLTSRSHTISTPLTRKTWWKVLANRDNLPL